MLPHPSTKAPAEGPLPAGRADGLQAPEDSLLVRWLQGPFGLQDGHKVLTRDMQSSYSSPDTKTFLTNLTLDWIYACSGHNQGGTLLHTVNDGILQQLVM